MFTEFQHPGHKAEKLNPPEGTLQGTEPTKQIMTYNCNPPIPVRHFDWSAWFDGEEEGLSASGKTEKEAIENLKELYEGKKLKN